jgi:hypothetical protein
VLFTALCVGELLFRRVGSAIQLRVAPRQRYFRTSASPSKPGRVSDSSPSNELVALHPDLTVDDGASRVLVRYPCAGALASG